MEKKQNISKPEVLGVEDWRTNIDRLVPKCTMTVIKSIEDKGTIGLYFIPPGEMTNVFSMESEDDGTAEEYYGLCHEFYFVLCGECTMYWGKDTSEIKAEKSNKLVVRAGEVGYWSPGWKYAPKNTGSVPLTFFWGITRPPEGTKRR